MLVDITTTQQPESSFSVYDVEDLGLYTIADGDRAGQLCLLTEDDSDYFPTAIYCDGQYEHMDGEKEFYVKEAPPGATMVFTAK